MRQISGRLHSGFGGDKLPRIAACRARGADHSPVKRHALLSNRSRTRMARAGDCRFRRCVSQMRTGGGSAAVVVEPAGSTGDEGFASARKDLSLSMSPVTGGVRFAVGKTLSFTSKQRTNR